MKQFLGLLSSDMILSFPVKSLLSIPAVADKLPESVIDYVKGLKDTDKLQDIPLPDIVSLGLQLAAHGSAQEDGPDVVIPDGAFVSCPHCTKTTFHKLADVRCVSSD